MTLVLAVETATPRCSVALGNEAGVLASSSVDRDRRHVEALVPAIAAACRSVGAALADVEALAVDVGPGLFTGMRVGIATVQGLAVALGVPVHPVSSLEVLAFPLRHAACPVAAVVDARRGEVFRALFQAGAELAGAACTTPAALADELRALGPCLAVGDGAVRYRVGFEQAGAEVVAAMPSAESALELALAALAAGHPGVDPADVEARYLRAPDARANFTVLRPRLASAAGPAWSPAPAPPAGTAPAALAATAPAAAAAAVTPAGPGGGS